VKKWNENFVGAITAMDDAGLTVTVQWKRNNKMEVWRKEDVVSKLYFVALK